MKLLGCPYHKLEEYKGHENSRIMNDETEEKGPFLTSYEFLAKKKKEEEEDHLINGSRAITWR